MPCDTCGHGFYNEELRVQAKTCFNCQLTRQHSLMQNFALGQVRVPKSYVPPLKPTGIVLTDWK